MKKTILCGDISGKLAQVIAILDLVVRDGGNDESALNAVWGARDIAKQTKDLAGELEALLMPYLSVSNRPGSQVDQSASTKG